MQLLWSLLSPLFLLFTNKLELLVSAVIANNFTCQWVYRFLSQPLQPQQVFLLPQLIFHLLLLVLLLHKLPAHYIFVVPLKSLLFQPSLLLFQLLLSLLFLHWCKVVFKLVSRLYKRVVVQQYTLFHHDFLMHFVVLFKLLGKDLFTRSRRVLGFMSDQICIW